MTELSNERLQSMLDAEIPLGMSIADARSLITELLSLCQSHSTGAVEALREIAAATDADDPESYRCDDREGCLDTVHSIATNALSTIEVPVHKDGEPVASHWRNTMGSEIPEWAMTEAQAFHDRWETGMSGAAFQEFARALVAAERRGIERAAVKADAFSVAPDPDEMDPYDEYEMGGRSTARAVAAAIRQLGDTP